jgi:small G protein signaling modulator 3
MQWLALVQNTHSQVEDLLTWSKVDIKRVQAVPYFDKMLLKDGVPHSLRPFLWPLLCGASVKRSKSD